MFPRSARTRRVSNGLGSCVVERTRGSRAQAVLGIRYKIGDDGADYPRRIVWTPEKIVSPGIELRAPGHPVMVGEANVGRIRRDIGVDVLW